MPKKRKARRTPRTRVIPLPKSADWYHNPVTVGHGSARRKRELAWRELKPFAKTKAQREFLNQVIDFYNESENYWWQVSKTEIAQAKHVLKGLKRGDSWETLYHWVARRHNMCMDSMLRYLEVKFYDENRTKYIEYNVSYPMWLGMSKDEAIERAEGRIKKYREGIS